MSGPGHTGPLVPVYTVEQTAEALGVSRATVHAMLRRGELRAVPTGAARCVVAADLEQHLAGKVPTAPAPVMGAPAPVDLADVTHQLEELTALVERIATVLEVDRALGQGDR